MKRARLVLPKPRIGRWSCRAQLCDLQLPFDPGPLRAVRCRRGCHYEHGVLDGHADRERIVAMAIASGQAGSLCAKEAGANQAIALSVRAKTDRWRLRFASSAELARRGYDCSPATPIRVLLASYEANAAALMGDIARGAGRSGPRGGGCRWPAEPRFRRLGLVMSTAPASAVRPVGSYPIARRRRCAARRRDGRLGLGRG